ncbi:hypothetical protein EK21DRAFT_104581 [Setomelanomma holmii]|uniref:Uncharacterized protein n=1 Tax=Setomelanomma holmii TaxID=210430 RepID=A0A9P4GZR2_9PLEO|nr:hypothetical protein EK21DRAFT_104581 [Setomelanomma holmii]
MNCVSSSPLRHEKDILEDGLANCVTYLNALRKKQARNERLLSVDPLPPRRKRKKIQQSKRELNRDIKNRERDEQAFLSSLQACNTNIYIAEGNSHTPRDVSSTAADYTSSTTQCSFDESEPTEISWTGFPSNTAQSQYQRAPLRPAAAVFEPVFEPLLKATSQEGYGAERRTQTLSILPPLSIPGFEDALARQATAASMIRTMQQLSSQARPVDDQRRNNTWCNTTPDGSPEEVARPRLIRRSRSNSL